MSIHKRMGRNGEVSWTVRYREGGANRRCTFTTRKDAQDFEAQVRLKSRQGTLHSLDAGKVELGEFAEKWWEEYVKARLAKATVHGYALAWNLHVLPYLGQRQLREITPRVIEEWRYQLERKGVGAPTVRKSMTVLQSCLQRAVVWGELQANPAREVRKPSAKRTRVVRPVTPKQVEAMRAHLIAEGKHRDATIVSVLAYAGLRPAEALALDWDHLRKNTLLVERSASYGEIKRTKTGKIRSVKLLPALRHDLNEWRMRSGDGTGLMFPSRVGDPWGREAYKSWERKAFKRAAEAAGCPDASPYTLRHSFASLMIHEGRSIVEVAAQLGHAPTMTLDTYAHVFADLDEDRRSADEMIESARSQIAWEQPGKGVQSWEHLENPDGVVPKCSQTAENVRRLVV